MRSPPLLVRVSLWQQPALPTDPAPQNNIHSLQPQRRIYYPSPRIASPPLPLSLPSSPLLLSPCIHRFRLFIFNPADVPHAWRRRARNTDTVNQSGRGSWGGAELEWEKAPPTPEKKKKGHVTCHTPPGSTAAAQETRWQRVGKHNLPRVDPTSFCQRVPAPSFSLKVQHAHSFVWAERRRVTYQSYITQ